MLIIKGGMIFDPKSEKKFKADILIENEKIIEIGEQIQRPEGCQIIDASGLCVAPGLVDVHVHFRDPGFTYKEDLETGAKAAAKGGFTTVVLMANTKPVVDNIETLNYILEKGKTTGIHVKTCATVTKGLQGQTLTSMEELKQAGAVGFTDDGIPIVNPDMIRKAMEETARLQVPISLHEEDSAMVKTSGINQGDVAIHLGMEGASREAEISICKRDLEIAFETKAIINIQHISSKEAVELVRQAKKRGTTVHCEASPHHFTLTQEAVLTKGTLAKMNPPLREEADRIAIIRGLKDGTIDIIATDHAPHSKEEKDKPFLQAPSGIIGLETAFSLGITHLVKTDQLTLMELLKKMSYNPAKLYEMEAGAIDVGAIADLFIFNPKETWTVKDFVSKSKNSPFIGDTLDGVIYYTICAGNMVYHLEQL